KLQAFNARRVIVDRIRSGYVCKPLVRPAATGRPCWIQHQVLDQAAVDDRVGIPAVHRRLAEQHVVQRRALVAEAYLAVPIRREIGEGTSGGERAAGCVELKQAARTKAVVERDLRVEADAVVEEYIGIDGARVVERRGRARAGGCRERR